MNSKNSRIGSKWDDMMSVLVKMENILNRFTKQNYENLAEIEHPYESVEIRDLLLKWIDSLDIDECHSTAITNAYRAKGNEMYKNIYTRGAEAIEYYTKAVFSAPKYSKELSLAHANRAAALIALDYFEEAYNDCEMAKNHSYPEENLLKVLLRQATCSTFLKRQDDLARNIYEIERHITKYNLKSQSSKLQEFQIELSKLKANREGLSPSNGQIMSNKSLKEKKSAICGRFVVAADNIKIDEAIIHENAFVFIPVYRSINGNTIDYNCQNCAKTNVIPFPCYDCVHASYCCPNCRESHVSIHQFECSGYKRMLWLEIGIAHLSLRSMIVGFASIFPIIEHFSKTPLNKVFNYLLDTAELDIKFQYGRVLRLVHNFNKMNKGDVLRYSLTAAMLTVYLKHYTNFFELIPKQYRGILSSTYEWEKLVNILITLHMGQLVSNGHAISDLTLTLPTTINCLHSKDTVRLGMLHCFISNERIFTALFPKISLFNHSCDPNIRNKFDKNSLTVYATRTINANEEIFNCYGPNWRLMNFNDRQSALKQQYCFDCFCSKCSSLNNKMTEIEPYICQNSNCRAIVSEPYTKGWWRNDDHPPCIQCRKCGHKQNFDWNLIFNRLIDRMKSTSSFEDMCNQACDIFQSATRFMCEHHEQKSDMALILLSNSVLLTGNERKFDLNKKLLKISKIYLKCCAHRYGKFSLEFVVASAFLLDLLAIRRKINENFEAEYDLDQITNSIEMLSCSSKVLFTNYIQNYILCD